MIICTKYVIIVSSSSSSSCSLLCYQCLEMQCSAAAVVACSFQPPLFFPFSLVVLYINRQSCSKFYHHHHNCSKLHSSVCTLSAEVNLICALPQLFSFIARHCQTKSSKLPGSARHYTSFINSLSI